MLKKRSLMLAPLGVLACAATARASQVTLRVTHAFPERERDFRNEIAQEFMARNPGIAIKLEATASDCGTLQLQLLRAGITGDLPDVSTPCYQEVGLLAQRGLLVPLDNLIAHEPAWDELGIKSNALSTTRWKGGVYALPESVSTSIIYYKMDILRRVGIDIEPPPQTWSEIIAIATAIKNLNAAIMSIFYEYYPDNFNWSFNGLVYSFGGEVFTPDGKIGFDGDAGLRALNLLRSFGEAGMIDMTTEQARQAFVAGKIGIYVASNSRLVQLTAGAGNQFEIRTAPFPQSAPNGKLQSGGGGIAMLTRDSIRQQAAWEYLKFAVSPMAQTIMVKRTGLSPVNTRAVESPEFLGQFYQNNPNALTAIQQLPRIRSMDEYPGPAARQITTVIRDHLQSVVTLKRFPREVMQDMVRDVSRLLPN